MTPLDLFLFCVAGAVGVAVGLLLLSVVLGATYIVGSALLRRFIGR
jgi:hypothetical protein